MTAPIYLIWKTIGLIPSDFVPQWGAQEMAFVV